MLGSLVAGPALFDVSVSSMFEDAKGSQYEVWVGGDGIGSTESVTVADTVERAEVLGSKLTVHGS